MMTEYKQDGWSIKITLQSDSEWTVGSEIWIKHCGDIMSIFRNHCRKCLEEVPEDITYLATLAYYINSFHLDPTYTKRNINYRPYYDKTNPSV